MEHHDGVAGRFRAWSTEDLVALLRKHDLGEWQPQVFETARQLLLDRGVDVEAALAQQHSDDSSRDSAAALDAIASFSTVLEAEALRSNLAAAGFRAYVLEENALAIDGAPNPALSRVTLAVPGEQAEDARNFASRLTTGPSEQAVGAAIRRGVVGLVTAAVMFLSLAGVTRLGRWADSTGTLLFWLAGTLIASPCLGASLGRRASGLSCSVFAVAWRATAAFLLGAVLAANLIGPAVGHSIAGSFLAVVFVVQFVVTAFGAFLGAGR